MNRHRSPHDPEELGAHVLGLLDAEQSAAVEQHLAVCAECRREWEELREMVDLLDDVPPEAYLDGPPDGGDLLLQRTLRQVRAEGGASRRRRRFVVAGAAAVALTAVLAGGVAIGRTTAPPPPVAGAPAPAPGATVLAGGGDPGVSMNATIIPAAGWVRLSATVAGVPPNERCRLVVVASDGRREIAGSWLVPQTGWRDGITLDGSALVAPDQVAAVVVENEAGHQFAIAQA